MSTALIFAGGPENRAPCLPIPPHDFVIAADSGLRLCERLGLSSDLVLGDFDSLGAAPTGYPVMTVPVEKDDTDTMLAAKTALERGFRDIRIYGAFGGRLDHTLANLQTLEYLLDAGAEGWLVSSENYAFLQRPGTREYPAIAGFSFSVFAWSGQCSSVSLSGVHYPLENAVLTRQFPLGVSNAVTGESARVSLSDGLLLVIGSSL